MPNHRCFLERLINCQSFYAVLTFSVKTFCVIFVLMAFMSNIVKIGFMSLTGIISMPLTFFISRIFRTSLISISLTVLKENLSLSETLDSLTTIFLFYKQLGSGLSPQSCLHFKGFSVSKLLNGCLVV